MRASLRRLIFAAALGLGFAAACAAGETGDGGDPAGAEAGSAATNAGNSGAGAGAASSGAGVSAAGGSITGAGGGTSGATNGAFGGGAGTNAGAAGGPASGSGGTGGSAASGGTSGAAADAGPAPGVPEPTDSGLSVYSTECRGETVHCESAAVHCLGIFLNEGGVGYTCSNLCRTSEDCSDAPSGAEASAGCVTFTSASRCVLVCYDNGEEYSCPSGMGCYRYPDFPVGYCLWL